MAITDRQGARLEMYQSVTVIVEPKFKKDNSKALEEIMLAEDNEERYQ